MEKREVRAQGAELRAQSSGRRAQGKSVWNSVVK
jgi:hypothetical protein